MKGHDFAHDLLCFGAQRKNTCVNLYKEVWEDDMTLYEIVLHGIIDLKYLFEMLKGRTRVLKRYALDMIISLILFW